MHQALTVKIKLLPTKKKDFILNAMGREYIYTINVLVSEIVAKTSVIRLEQLTNIKQTKNTSRKYEKNLHT